MNRNDIGSVADHMAPRLQDDWIELIINNEPHYINLSNTAGVQYSGVGLQLFIAGGQSMHIPMNHSNYQHFWELIKLGKREVKFTDEVFAAVIEQKLKEQKNAQEKENKDGTPEGKGS